MFIQGVSSSAADTASVGKCLLGNCATELGQCLADASCVQNLVCLQSCNGKSRDEESRCQVGMSQRQGVVSGIGALS
jgi:hypothetical protein